MPGLDISALSTYNNETQVALVGEVINGANTIKGNLVTVMYGLVGDTVKIPSFSNSINASNSTCGWVNTGTTTLNQSTMQMCSIRFQEAICLDTLYKYFTSWEQGAKYNVESTPFEEVFFKSKTDYVAAELDQIAWRADNSVSPYVAGLSSNLLRCRGFMGTAYQLSASTIEITKSALTTANAYTVVDQWMNSILTNMPEIADKSTLSLFMSPADFQTYLFSLRGLNLYQYNTQSAAISEILHPGSIALMVKKADGLRGAASGTMLATIKENIILGISDASDLDFATWFSRDNSELRLEAKIRIGTGFVQPELVLYAI